MTFLVIDFVSLKQNISDIHAKEVVNIRLSTYFLIGKKNRVAQALYKTMKNISTGFFCKSRIDLRNHIILSMNFVGYLNILRKMSKLNSDS